MIPSEKTALHKAYLKTEQIHNIYFLKSKNQFLFKLR